MSISKTCGARKMEYFIEWCLSPKPYLCLATLLITLVVWVALRKFITRMNGKSDKKDAFAGMILNLVKYALAICCILTILQINGINVTSAITGLGIASVIVGLALQDALKDIIMGVNIISENFYRVGDVVEIGDYVGKVTSMTLKSTRLLNSDEGYEVRICNRDIDKVKVLNGMTILDIPLSYHEDPEKVKKVFDQIVKEVSTWKECKKAEFLGLQNYEDSDMIYRLRVYCAPIDRLPLRRKVLQEVDKVLRENDISIPFPQLDVHPDT